MRGCLLFFSVVSGAMVVACVYVPFVRELAALFIVTVLLAVAVLAIPSVLRVWIARLRFRGNTYFVYRRSRGWEAIVENNVLPVLGERHIQPFRRPRLGRDGKPTGKNKALVHLITLDLARSDSHRSHPFLLTIARTHRRKPRVVPLHEALRPLKPRGKRSTDTQAQVAAILDAALQADTRSD